MITEKLTKEWINRLGLNDWTIKFVVNCTPDDIGYENCGLSVWQEVRKTAKVQILDPKYYGERILPFDEEKTLVHELLHLKTCFISETDNELQERIMHQLIDDLACALVDAKRSEKHDSD